MSKELEALDKICEHLDLDDDYFYCEDGEKTDFEIVEAALKDYEELKKTLKQYDIFSVYELKDRLDRLKDIEKAIKKVFPNNEYTFGLLVDKIRNIELQEETDEVLEILNDYVVDIGILKDSKSVGEYNHRLCQRYFSDFQDFNNKPQYKALGEEAFNLLKKELL